MKHIKIHNQPTQPSTFAIRTSQYTAKNCKRACLSAIAFLPTQKTNFFGNAGASIEQLYECNILIMNEHQQLTGGIVNKGVNGLRNFVVRFNFSNGGQGRSPQSLTNHTAKPLGFMRKVHCKY